MNSAEAASRRSRCGARGAARGMAQSRKIDPPPARNPRLRRTPQRAARDGRDPARAGGAPRERSPRRSAEDDLHRRAEAPYQRVEALAAWRPLSDDQNIVYFFHFYDPMAFTHQGLTWDPADPLVAPRRRALPGNARRPRRHAPARTSCAPPATPISPHSIDRALDQPWTKETIAGQFAPLAEWSRAHDAPVNLNEFGALQLQVRARGAARMAAGGARDGAGQSVLLGALGLQSGVRCSMNPADPTSAVDRGAAAGHERHSIRSAASSQSSSASSPTMRRWRARCSRSPSRAAAWSLMIVVFTLAARTTPAASFGEIAVWFNITLRALRSPRSSARRTSSSAHGRNMRARASSA